MKLLTMLLLILLPLISALSQPIEIKGRVVDANTGEGIPWASVCLYKQKIGTTSNEKGYFNLTLNKKLLNDSVDINNLGYCPLKLSVSQLASDTIRLKRKNYALPEVYVGAKAGS